MNYFNNTKVLLCLAACTLAPLSANAQPAGSNIALGKTATFDPAPNYSLCTDPDDSKQLTDGIYASSGNLQKVENTTSIWVQKGTVGWVYKNPVVITIDLGKVQPISGVSYSTASGVSDVTLPTAIYIAVSDDNIHWHTAGNLMALSEKKPDPLAQGYHTFQFVTHQLHTKGRYLSLGVVSLPYAFVDEVEVFKGNDAWLQQPLQGELISNMKDYVNQCRITAAAQQRLDDDIATIRHSLQETNLSPTRKNALEAQLDKDSAVTAAMPLFTPDHKTILPLNETHADILAVHGELLAAQGIKPLTVWKQHRYAWLPLLAKPSAQDRAQLNISMLGNQFRSDGVLLTNAGEKPQKIALQLKNPPRGAQAGWLQAYSVAWTDTAQHVPVADALLPLQLENGNYNVEVPAGMTRKVWFTVDSSKVPAGAYKSIFEVSGAGQQTAVPFALNVSSLVMGKPRISLGVWDYTNGNGLMGITPQNREAAIALMRSHYVDTPWATGVALPRPGAADFNARGDLESKLDFSELDRWMALWPGVKQYFVYGVMSDSFAGAPMDSPEFNTRVGSWAKALSAHMKERGLQPQQLGILLVDEPRNDKMDATIAAWAKAINAAAPELTLFEDTNWLRPDQAAIQDAITQIDILSPQFPIYKRGGAPVQKYFEDLRASGKTLWFYQCTGPVRLYDPQGYYRSQAWNAFGLGATGEQFWAFADTGGAPTSWNDYDVNITAFAPVFIDKDTVYDSIHWDAVREGVEDYEELAMLRDAITASHNPAWKQQAQQVLEGAVQAVTGTWSSDYTWQKNSDPSLTDTQLQKVRDALERQK